MRVHDAPLFTVTGEDFTGALYVKEKSGCVCSRALVHALYILKWFRTCPKNLSSTHSEGFAA
ncbi:hypothetical protein DPMN_093491 [Dreissena polymorpha]|uniref:Uncharacterized protein n=1 Tax=Dreissena polymorpha TaxID=45954 RepID=A0A9D4L497_DREPO|nr:hypothetical protein DPMN_093491 [Dreissena polymorpha]